MGFVGSLEEVMGIVRRSSWEVAVGLEEEVVKRDEG